jgi:hypothetical protein
MVPSEAKLHKGAMNVADPVTLGLALIVVVAEVVHKFKPVTVIVYVPDKRDGIK